MLILPAKQSINFYVPDQARINETVKDLCLLANVQQLTEIVTVINMLDLIPADLRQQTYLEACNHYKAIIQANAPKVKSDQFIPTSGLHNYNVVHPNYKELPWWGGKTLLQALESSRLPYRPVGLPLQIQVLKRYKVTGYGLVVIAKIQTGAMDD